MRLRATRPRRCRRRCRSQGVKIRCMAFRRVRRSVAFSSGSRLRVRGMASSPNPRDPRPSSVPCRDRWAAATRRTRPFRAGRAHPCPRRVQREAYLPWLGWATARVVRTDPPGSRVPVRRGSTNSRFGAANGSSVAAETSSAGPTGSGKPEVAGGWRPGEPQTRRFARPIG